MNKLIIGLMVVTSLFMASTVLAEDVPSTPGKIIVNTSKAGSELTIGLSKGVEVRYINPGGTDAEAQWYVVASVHSGGNKGYATAQNLTNIMVRDYEPGSPTGDFLGTIPEVSASAQDWPNNWSPQ